MTHLDAHVPRKKNSRRHILTVGLLPIFLLTIFVCSFVGLWWAKQDRIEIAILQTGTANYRPWERDIFGPVDPELGTAIAVNNIRNTPGNEGTLQGFTQTAVVLSTQTSAAVTQTLNPSETRATAQETATLDPSITMSVTPTGSITPTGTQSPSPTPSESVTPTPSVTSTATPSRTTTSTATRTLTRTPTRTASPSVTRTPTLTPTRTLTSTIAATFTPTATNTLIPSATIAPTFTFTPISSATPLPSSTLTPIPPTNTFTPLPTFTPIPTDTLTFTPVPPWQVDYGVTISTSDPTPLEGDIITLTVRISSTSTPAMGTVNGIQVQHVLPAGLTYIWHFTTRGSYNTSNGLWTLNMASPSGPYSLFITAQVNMGTAGNVINATTSLVNDSWATDLNLVNNNAGTTITVGGFTDLGITKSVSNGNPIEGESITYTVTVNNSGLNATNNITIVDVLPAEVTFGLATTTQGTFDNLSGLWNVGTLGSGGSATLTLVTTVNAGTGGSTSLNTATLTGSSPADNTPGNNSASASITVQMPTAPDIAVTKSVNIPNPAELTSVIFTIGITNNGTLDATSVVVNDLLPAGVTYTTSIPSQGSYDPISGNWTVGNLNVGASASLAVTVQVNAGTQGTTITNGASLISTTPSDSNPGNNGASASITVQPIGLVTDLSISKSVSNPTPPEASSVTYTINVTNNGPTNVTGLQASDILPANITYVIASGSQGTYNPGTGIWSIGNLASGTSATLNMTVNVSAGTQGMTITNIASVIVPGGITDTNPANNSANASLTVAVTCPCAELAITQTTSNTSPAEGEEVAMTVTVTNNGPLNATGVTVTDVVPASLSGSVVFLTGGTYVGNTWTIGNLNVGASVTMELYRTVNPGTQGTTITNTATITASTPTDPNATNNSASVNMLVEAAVSADLGITKMVDIPNPNVGDLVTFEVMITNNGPDAAFNVLVSDPVPVGLTYIIASYTLGTYDQISGVWNVGTLPFGASSTLSIVLQVNVGTGGSVITNTATITSSSQADPNPVNNSANAPITVQSTGDADLGITKTVDNPTPNENDLITFFVTINNAGPNTATNILVADVLPAGLFFSGASATQGTYDSGLGLWTVGNLNTGTSATLSLSANVNSGTAGTTITNTASVVASDQIDLNGANNSGSSAVVVQAGVQVADFAIPIMLVNDSTPTEGDIINYELQVQNFGPYDGTGLQVADVLPPGLTYVSHSLSTGVYDPITGIWNIGNLTVSGGPAILSINVQVDAGTGGSTIINTANITFYDQMDPNLGNNSISTPIVVQSADLALTKTASIGTFLPGQTFTYSITVTNNGPTDAINIAVTDLLPPEVTYISYIASQGTYDNVSGQWVVGNLPLFATATLNIDVVVNFGTSGLTVTNTASVSGIGQVDPDWANNTATFLFLVQ